MSSSVTAAVETPISGRYRIDPARSVVSFTTRHLFGLAPVRGTFGLTEGHIDVADPVTDTAARAVISATSFDTGVPARDSTVRSAQYLDADNHPGIVFNSTGLRQVEGQWTLHGSLTVRDRTSPVEVVVNEVRPDGSALRLRARCRIDRYAFGITAMKGMTGRRLMIELGIVAERLDSDRQVGQHGAVADGAVDDKSGPPVVHD